MNVVNLLSSQLKCQKLNCEVGICLLTYSLNNIFPGLASSSQTTNREKKKKEKDMGKIVCAPSTEKNKMNE